VKTEQASKRHARADPTASSVKADTTGLPSETTRPAPVVRMINRMPARDRPVARAGGKSLYRPHTSSTCLEYRVGLACRGSLSIIGT
jgi:hypothetical protein